MTKSQTSLILPKAGRFLRNRRPSGMARRFRASSGSGTQPLRFRVARASSGGAASRRPTRRSLAPPSITSILLVRFLPGSARVPRAWFGRPAQTFRISKISKTGVRRDAGRSTRDACAPQTTEYHEHPARAWHGRLARGFAWHGRLARGIAYHEHPARVWHGRLARVFAWHGRLAHADCPHPPRALPRRSSETEN